MQPRYRTATTFSIQLAPSTGGTLSRVEGRNWSPVYRLRGDPRKEEGYDYSGLNVVFRKDTQYHRLAVVEDETTRTLRFDSSYQSAMTLGRPFRTEFEYTDYFQLGLTYHPAAKNILFIGLGGVRPPKRFWRDFSGASAPGVEIRPGGRRRRTPVLSLFRRARASTSRCRTAGRYLAENEALWDVLRSTRSTATGSPSTWPPTSSSSWPGRGWLRVGLIVTNLIGSVRHGSKLFRSIYRTYRSVFPTVVVHPVIPVPAPVSDETLNLMLVATDRLPRPRVPRRSWKRTRARVPTAPNLAIPDSQPARCRR